MGKNPFQDSSTRTHNTGIAIIDIILELRHRLDRHRGWAGLLLQMAHNSIWRKGGSSSRSRPNASQRPGQTTALRVLKSFVLSTCSSGSVISPGVFSIPEDLQRGISADTILTAHIGTGCAVHLREAHRLKVIPRALFEEPVDDGRTNFDTLFCTLASGTIPLRRVAAASYSGASRLQWPHLQERQTFTTHQFTQ